METGKTSKYFKYAIGEIILVVIGILIALQINNWNEARKDASREAQLKSELILEFNRDLEQLNSKIKIRKRIIDASIKLLNYRVQTETANSDSIKHYMSSVSYRPTFDPISVEYIEKSDINLIKNDDLRRLLTAWKVDVTQLREDELNWKDYVITYRYSISYKIDPEVSRDLQNLFWKSNGSGLFLIDKNSTREVSPLPEVKRQIDYKKIIAMPFWEVYCTRAVQLNIDANLNSSALKLRIKNILKLLHE